MSSLPTSFPYGSAASTYSVRDAIASYRRSQYFASSNAQSADPRDELVDDEQFSAAQDYGSPGNSWQERPHVGQPQCEAGVVSMRTTEWDIPTPKRLIRPDPHQSEFQQPGSTPRVRGHGDRETTPLLRRSASFPVSPTPRTVQHDRADNSPLVPQDTVSNADAPKTLVEHHHGGKSTYGQTLFNCIAVLLGIGMLSEPLAFAYAGWFWGTTLIVCFGIVTCYTAKLLAYEILVDPRLRSYADIGRKAFGPRSYFLTSSLFCLELFSLSVVLITLSADSLHAVWPSYTANTYKICSLLVLLPTVFMPLSILSFTSLLGIVSTLLIIAVIFIDGFSKRDSPGSLWSPAETSFSPGTFGEVGVAFGLLMAGFSGHVVIPSLARDMIDPTQFDHMANWAFAVATFVYAVIGYAGYLMFGSSVSDEISRDLLATTGYNTILNKIALWLLVITPLSKFALSTRPLNIILEIMLGLDATPSPTTPEDGKDATTHADMSFMKGVLMTIERIMVPALSITVSILVPQFSVLMAFLGSFSAFVICVIGPIAAKIALTGRRHWYDATLLGMSFVMAAWGTFSAFWTV